MTQKRYVKRATKRWLEGAPEYVADVFDNPNFADRYTVIFKDLDHAEHYGHYIHYLGLNDYPTNPNMGFSQFGEMKLHELTGYRRTNAKRRITWGSLPENVKEHIKARYEND